MHQGTEGGSFRDHQRHRAKEKNRRVVQHRAVFQQANLRGLKIVVRMLHHSERGEYGLDRKTSQQYIFAPPIGDSSITDSSNWKDRPVTRLE